MALAEMLLNHNAFTNKPIHTPTQTTPEKVGDSLKYAWTAMSPNIPLPLNRQGDKVYDIVRDKHGIGGGEMEWGAEILRMVGPKIYAFDSRDAQVGTGVAVAAIVREYRTAITKLAREENRYANPDIERVREKQADLVARMIEKINKAKGEVE